MQSEDLWILIQELQKALRPVRPFSKVQGKQAQDEQAQNEADSVEKLENLLKGLLTPKEIEEFAERIRIVQLLKKGVGQHAIAARLKVGVATVGRGAQEIREGNFKYV